MKILFYDCFAGISGDMNLGAMIDLGVEPDFLRAELSKLGLDSEFELKISGDSRHGIHGTRMDVILKGQRSPDDPEGNASSVAHGHGHAISSEASGQDQTASPHAHGSSSKGRHPGHGAHRNFADIASIIQGSGLPPAVQETSLAIFRKVAEAEARVHGTTIQEIHFHEVGAADSIVDIVGAAICLHRLDVDAVWSSPVELGGGFVRCAHGLLPVPAPATVEILHGIPTTRGAVQKETTTPTGAAILAMIVDRFTGTPEMISEKTGYGIGHRETEIPNVLRVHLARSLDERMGRRKQPACMLQCNIDDMTAEALGVVMETFMEAGAMDVHFTPILMKKNRPATSVSLLCDTKDASRFKELFFLHTTTLGIKQFPLEKEVLETVFEELTTPLGRVRMKKARMNGKVIRSKPELEDCRAIARERKIPLTEVYAQVWRSLRDD